MDPLKYIFDRPFLTGRVLKWQVMLSEYDIEFTTQKSIKGSVIADHLAEHPLSDEENAEGSVPEEEVIVLEKDSEDPEVEADEWVLFFDGAVNTVGSGLGALLVSPEGKHFPIAIKLDFRCTNNIAEYEACTAGLEAALQMGIKKLKVYGDSALIIHQVIGDWQTKDAKLIPYQKYLAGLMKEFENINFHHLSRDKNRFADALATLAAMAKVDEEMNVEPLNIELRLTPACCANIDNDADGKPWYHDIKLYVEKGEYPLGASENEKRTLRRLSANFFLSFGKLYKRSPDGALLECVGGARARRILEDIHGGVCGIHANGYKMTGQIMRAGFYWSTLETDCISCVRKCPKCQAYGNKLNLPPTKLHSMVAPWPFAMWGMDVIGPINPKASNGHCFILVAIDYFTKWIEAITLSSVTQQAVARFVKKEIICRYGQPDVIITDNASNLNGSMMKALCEKFKIRHLNSTPYRPKMNGAVEAANKNIKRIIAKMTVTYKDWHEMLPYALMGYRVAVRASTGATPYSLVYGFEAVIPIEVEIPSLRVLLDAELEEAEWVRTRYEQLNLIEEKRLRAICHGQLYQQRVARAHDKKVRPRQFREGNIVLRKIAPCVSDKRGKWAPTYDGPYVVKKAFSGGALILTHMNGEELPKTVNADEVKQYHV